MSLRLKTYLLGGVALLAGLATIFFASQVILSRDLAGIERAEMRNQTLRARAAIDRNLTDLSAAMRSYSSWDDTLAFLGLLGDQEANSPSGELTASFFRGLHANLVVLVKNDSTIAWGSGFDLGAGTTASLPAGLSDQLTPGSPLVRHDRLDSQLSGILILPAGPMLVSSQPLLATGGQGPAPGALVAGRWLDASLVAQLSRQTGLALEVLPLGAEGSNVIAQGKADPATENGGITFTALDSETMTGSLAVDDIFGQPAVQLRVKMPRVVSLQGAGSLRDLTIALICVAIVFGLATVAFLERSLFRRLARLTGQVWHVFLGGGQIADLHMGGKDELALMAQTISAGLTELSSRIENTRESTRREHDKQAAKLAQTIVELEGRHSDLERAHRHLQELQEASVSLSGALEIRDALAHLEHIALEILESDELWLLELGNDQGLEGLAAFCRDLPVRNARLPRVFGCERADGRLPQNVNRLLKRVLEEDKAIFIDSIPELGAGDQELLLGASRRELRGLSSLALVPLSAKGSPVGLAVSASLAVEKFTDDRKSTILLFAGQVAQALKNARLYEEIKILGEIDSLSGLHNRRRSLDQLESEVTRASRSMGTFSILIADVDNFKLFNDTYGHPVGDEIIKRVAALLRRRTRASDFVGRFGGDEFILILPETYRAQAAGVADTLRAALSSLPYVAPDGAAIPLRMSFGVASFPADGLDSASLIATADANLYESKRWGGDTVTVKREPVSGETVDSQGFSTLDALVSSVDNKDHYTRRHSAQVAEHAAAIALSLAFTDERHETLRVASLLHDVGKIALPDRILRKPGALTCQEEEAVKQHALVGSMMISQHLPGLDEVRQAVVAHHENWDGTGYPAGLRGADIPLLGRIIAVADAYSAMTTDRPYRAALEVSEAVAELDKGTGTQFDPEIVRVFTGCLSLGLAATPGKMPSHGSQSCGS